MRRLLTSPPKGVRYEVVGHLTRATINASEGFKPFSFTPYQPHFCPVCGKDAGLTEDHISTIISLEFLDTPILDLITWAHPECFDSCVETDEQDRDLE